MGGWSSWRWSTGEMQKKNCNLFFDGWTHVAGDESPKKPYTLTMMFNTDLT
jgi:hypothetical protein